MDRDFRQYIRKISRITVQTAILVRNDSGDIMLLKRAGSEEWGLPLGKMTPGESLEDTARRELWEETANTAEEMKLIQMFSGPNFKIKHANGDEEYLVIGLFEATGIRSELNPQAVENKTMKYYPLHKLPSLDTLSTRFISVISDEAGKDGA